MKRLLALLFIVFILALSLIGCGESSEITGLKSYLAETEAIISEAVEIAGKVSNLYGTTGRYSEAEIVQECANYGKQYDDLLSRLIILEYPQECAKYREYIIDGIGCSKKEITEVGAAFATRDIEHLYKAESYYNEAQDALILAADEWDRLADIAEEGDGIGILEIFLGLLGLGVAITIAMFVLQLTLGVGFGIIAGITVAIGAIVEKIKGGDKRREQARQLHYDSAAIEYQEEEDEHGVWEIYRKEWETASPEKRLELNKRMNRWQELMKDGLTARQAYLRVLEQESVENG